MTYIPTKADIDYLLPLGSASTPPTGGITVPQSPSGAITTNTGRTTEATQTYVTKLNPQTQQGTPLLTTKPVMAGVPSASLPWYDGSTSGVNP